MTSCEVRRQASGRIPDPTKQQPEKDGFMDSALGWLCVLGIVFGIVTLVGHGIWITLAALNHVISGSPTPPGASPEHRCPACRATMPAGAMRCHSCGWRADPQPQTPLRALDGLVKQVESLHNLGSLDALSFERLNDALQTELGRVRTQIQAAAAAQRQAALERSVQSLAEPETIESANIFEAVSEEPEPAGPRQISVPRSAKAEIERPAATVETPPALPVRTWSQILDGFMEERNLRWGELIGGMLIVCGSIALVISFWSQIAERPFLKFVVFNGFTAAMFGAGVYCDRRLRLSTTSRGIYSIATLLVPLNFLALASFSRDAAGDNFLTIAGELVSIGLFGWLTWLAGRTTTPRAAVLLSVGVVGPSVAALLVRRFAHQDSGLGVLYALALLPVAFYLMANATSLWRLRAVEEPSEPEVHSLFRLLGVTTFAAVLPLGLLVTRTGDVTATLRWLAPLMSLAAGPGLATGLFVWQRVTSLARTGVRTAGSGVAIAGVLILLLGITFAWPHPTVMLLVALVDFAVLSAIAFTQSMPAAHLLALPCLGLAYLIVVHVLRGELSWASQTAGKMTGALLSAASGTALTPLALLFGGAAAGLAGTRRDDSRFYGIFAALAAGLSLVLVTTFGLGRFGDPGGASWVCGIYAVALLAIAFGLERRQGAPKDLTAGTDEPLFAVTGHTAHQIARAVEATAWVGAGLLLVAFIQGAVFNLGHAYGWPHPWLLALLGHASVLTLAAFGFRKGTAEHDQSAAPAEIKTQPAQTTSVSDILCQAAVITSMTGGVCLAWLVPSELPGHIAWRGLWLSCVWAVLSWQTRSTRLFAAFQGGLTATTVFAVSAWIHSQPWGATVRDVWLDPWSWQLQGASLSLLCLLWVALRMSTRPTPVPSAPSGAPPALVSSRNNAIKARLCDLMAPAYDRIVGWSLLALFLAMSIYAAVPGVAQELAPRSLAVDLEISRGAVVPATGRVKPALSHFEFAGIPHQHALGWGAWVWMAGVALLFMTWQREKFRVAHNAGLLLTISAVCPLVSGLWESDVATASALRWMSALFLAGVSAGTWIWQARRPATERDGVGWLTALVLVVSAAPLAAMGLFVSTAAISRFPLGAELESILTATLVISVFAVPIGVILRIMSARWISHLPPETVLATAAAARRRAGGMRHASVLIWILGAGPLVAVGLFIVSAALRGNPIVGPEPGTLFQRMGLAASYATPVALCALTLVGYAIRERSSGFSFAAGLLFNVSATAAYLLIAARNAASAGLKFEIDILLSIRIAQLNAIVSAVYGLCWMATVKFAATRQLEADALAANEAGVPLRRIAGVPIPGLLVTQSLIGIALTGVIQIPCFIGLFFAQHASPELAELAEPLGRTAWFLTLAGIFVLGWLARMRPAPGVVCAALCSLGLMAASYACQWETDNFVAYRTLLVAQSLAAWCVLLGFAGVGTAEDDEPTRHRGVATWSLCLSALVVVLACRHVGRPETTGPAVAAILSQSVLAAALACWMKQRSYIFLTGVLASLAQTLWWLYGMSPRPSLENLWTALIHVNVRAWLLPAFASMLIERWLIEPHESKERDQVPSWQLEFNISFHRIASAVSVACLALVAGAELVVSASGATLTIIPALQWQALACVVLMTAACLWDVRSVAPSFSLYLLGLVTAAMSLNHYQLAPRMIGWNGILILAGYSVATALLWLRRSDVVTLAQACRIPTAADDKERVHRWLHPANLVLSIFVLAGAVAIDLWFPEMKLRLATGTAALIPGVAVGLLARREPATGESSLHDCITALVAGLIGIVAWSWAWMNPQEVDAMHRFVVMTAALAWATVVYGLGIAKLVPAASTWARAGTRLAPALCLLTLGAVIVVIGNEASYFLEISRAPMAWPAIIVMALTILGLCAAALTAALVPGRDPLNLSERGRTAYVYATEALLAILFLHVRFTIPELFHGFFLRFWPFIVMFIAFTGVGVSEIFRRQRRLVLADPLERTGALLPILPILGFWASPTDGHFSLVLLAAGAIYSVLSLLRKSFGFGLLAAIAANGGLWYFLHHVEGYGVLQHPQLWMIPFAICVLGAAYLNHERLSAEQMTTIRYVASITIYVSSTADIFLNGVSEAPFLPVILAGLAVAGIFVGILLQVRAFLFLGTGFLALAMLTIIWYAAVDLHHTWLIWLTVVFAGVLVLGIFAVFEKKRQEILHVVEKIRQWSP
jgi:hypothetical protein